MSGLVLNSLACIFFAVTPVEASPHLQSLPSRAVASHPDGLRESADSIRHESSVVAPTKMVEPEKDPLVVGLGRSRLLYFPAGIRRTAVSNAEVSDVVQVSPKESLVLGRKQGISDITIWLVGQDTAPITIVVRVEQKQER